MILFAELVVAFHLVIITAGFIIFGKAIRENIIWNKIAGGILLIGGVILFVCTLCHMIKYHDKKEYGFHHYYGGKKYCYYKCKKYKEKLKGCDDEDCEKYKSKIKKWCKEDD
jgi:hypothetical protein